MKASQSLLNRRLALSAAALIVAGAAIGTQSGSARNSANKNAVTASVAEPQGIEGQLTSEVRDALGKNTHSQNSEAWHESGFTPDALFTQVHAFRSPEAFAALCQVLGRLKDGDLALFEEELSAPKNRSALKCASALSQRIARYWKSQQAQVDQERAQAEKNLSPALVSKENYLDASQGETLDSGTIPRHIHEGEFAILIDDGAHPARTPKILAALKRFGVRANFFPIGESARAFPEIIQQEVAAGHTVGSHTMHHVSLGMADMKTAMSEIQMGRQAVAQATNAEIPFFRFPYDAHSEAITAYVREHAMASLQGDLDSQDWKRRDAGDLVKHLTHLLDTHRSGVISFHDTLEQTAIVMPHFLAELQARGLKTVVFVPHRTLAEASRIE